MDTLLETIEVDVDESHELLFKVKVEGTDPSPAKVRLVCEAGDVAYMFTGRAAGHDDVVRFDLPAMKGKLKEGDYHSRVEVLVDNRYFAPVQFNLKFMKTVSVVAESLNVAQAIKKQPEIRVSASPIVNVKKSPASTPKTTPVVENKNKLPTRDDPPVAKVASRLTLKERFGGRDDD